MRESFNKWWENFMESEEVRFIDPMILDELRDYFFSAFKRGYELSENCNAHRT